MHEKFEKMIWEGIDSFTTNEQKELKEHLATCENCSKELSKVEQLFLVFKNNSLNETEKSNLWENICAELKLDEKVEGWEKISNSFLKETLGEKDKTEIWNKLENEIFSDKDSFKNIFLNGKNLTELEKTSIWENICAELKLDEKVEGWEKISNSFFKETLGEKDKTEIWNKLENEIFTQKKPSNVFELKPKQTKILRWSSIAIAASFAFFVVVNNWNTEIKHKTETADVEIKIPNSEHIDLQKKGEVNVTYINVDTLTKAEKDSLKADSLKKAETEKLKK
ncbi:hypothetical protein IT568_01490 [bacterium]|nr:hypothetical protein [bacterium]